MDAGRTRSCRTRAGAVVPCFLPVAMMSSHGLVAVGPVTWTLYWYPLLSVRQLFFPFGYVHVVPYGQAVGVEAPGETCWPPVCLAGGLADRDVVEVVLVVVEHLRQVVVDPRVGCLEGGIARHASRAP